MKIVPSFVCLPFLLAVTTVAPANAATKPFTIDIKNAQGQSVGTATLSEAPHGVKISLDIKKLPPGEHSLHIHQNAKCETPDFKSAGPHFNPAGGPEHGDHAANAAGLPAGDIPDFALV